MYGSTSSSRYRRYGAFAVLATGVLVTAACSSTPAVEKLDPAAVAQEQPGVIAKELRITPADGSQNADPASGITVTSMHGKLTKVTVHSSGDSVSGSMSSTGTSWHSKWTLGTASSYTVTATGTDGKGHPITARSTFRTLAPHQVLHTQIYEGSGQYYGVGMPVMLSFDRPVSNRAAIERSLELRTSKRVVGSWYWDGNQHLYFRPRGYWPAGTAVHFTGHLNGVQAAPGVYGAADLTQSFNIGQSIITVADTTSHRANVYVGGKLTFTWPISTGRATLPTPNGTYLTVEKHNPVRMIGGGKKGSKGYYNELVNWAVRFTFSGDYLHSAPWSVVNQGVSNVSHGCVNLSPKDAKTFYEMAIPGDPVTIVHSPKTGRWDDGWTVWFFNWHQFLQGSALHKAVMAGPDGSKFVSPSAAGTDTASYPTGTSATGNYLGG